MENKIRIQRSQEDLYRINIADDGTEIVFDLADINLPFRCEKVFRDVNRNAQIVQGKIKALQNQVKEEKKDTSLFDSVDMQIFRIYKEMFDKNRELMDEFFGCPGAMQKLFGDANYIDMYDDLFTQLEPHFEAMKLNVNGIKERLSKKYRKQRNNVLKADDE